MLNIWWGMTPLAIPGMTPLAIPGMTPLATLMHTMRLNKPWCWTLTQDISQNTNYLQLDGMDNWLCAVITMFTQRFNICSPKIGEWRQPSPHLATQLAIFSDQGCQVGIDNATFQICGLFQSGLAWEMVFGVCAVVWHVFGLFKWCWQKKSFLTIFESLSPLS